DASGPRTPTCGHLVRAVPARGPTRRESASLYLATVAARSMVKRGKELLQVDGKEVAISNPNKVLCPDAGYTKLDLVRYYLAVAEGALRGAGGRPNVLVRYPNGIGQEFFYQKRAPESRPDWIEVVALKFPSG